MPNFLMVTDSGLFPLPEYKRFGGKGGGNAAPQVDWRAQMEEQERMMQRQMTMQQNYQREAEARMREERERERLAEYNRRIEAAKEKEQNILSQEQQEAATLQEMTGQAKKEMSEFGGGFNLDMPTIERPGYESETRPQ